MGVEGPVGLLHQSTLRTVKRLGELYEDQGRAENAEVTYRRALSGFQRVLGPDHTSTLRMVNHWGDLYRLQERLTEAEAMYLLEQ